MTHRATLMMVGKGGGPVAAKLGIQTQPATTQLASVAFTTQPVVLIQTAGGATVTGSTASVIATITAGSAIGGTLLGTATVNAVAGVATFTNLAIDNVDTYTITFASSGLTSATSASFTNGPISKFISVSGGTSVFDYFYHSTMRVATSGSNVVTWDDVRGSSFAPTMLPNSGGGGTPPTLSSGTINTNGPATYIGSAAANTKFRFDQTARTDFICGELKAATGAYNGGWQTGSFELLQGASGASGMGLYPTNAFSAKVQPGAGVRSCWIISNDVAFNFPSIGTEAFIRMWFEWVGRGTNQNPGSSYVTASGQLIMGMAASGSYGGVCNIRHMIRLNIPMTTTIRIAYETMVQDATLGDSPSLYAAADSKGACWIVGDSIAAGSSGGVTNSINTPLDTSTTFLPSYIQAAVNTASKNVDCSVMAVGGTLLNDMISSGAFDRAIATMSPARRAAGFKDVIYVEASTNDLTAGVSAATLEAQITTLVGKVHAAGGKIVVQTCIPRSGFYTSSAQPPEVQRLAYNAWLRTNSVGADAIADPTTNAHFADPSGGSDTITSNTSFYADGIHPNPGGTAVMGPICGAAVVSIV